MVGPVVVGAVGIVVIVVVGTVVVGTVAVVLRSVKHSEQAAHLFFHLHFNFHGF